MKRILAVLLVFVFASTCLWGCSVDESGVGGSITVYSGDGSVMESGSFDKLSKSKHFAYIDTVISEASEIICEIEGCEAEKGKEQLFSGEYSIYTAFDEAVYDSMEAACTEYEGHCSFGCAVTTYDGVLLATYSLNEKEGDSTNYSVQKTAPYSAFKPLSVYAPALENGIINWSSTFEDSPYKQRETSTGVFEDWPQNATGTYSYENTTIYDALKVSVNTVAVKALSELGVEKSLDFLKESFDLTLSYEEDKMNELGEEEIIGNVALGYLVEGVSPVDMAGYYTIFANGGEYSKPRSVLEIRDREGNSVYTDATEAKRVISEETAYIMNELLSGVVSLGGTGERAYVDGVSVVGKTGTGTDYSGNWFVGVTPEYSCAVWHSEFGEKNCCPELFSRIISGLEVSPKTFIRDVDVQKLVYCKESGKLLSDKCRSVELGYYGPDNIPEQCDIHE